MSLATNSGATWKSENVPSSRGFAREASCPSALNCVALIVGKDVLGALVTLDGGRQWQAVRVPRDALLVGTSCPTASDCVAVGSKPGSAPAASPLRLIVGCPGLWGTSCRKLRGSMAWRVPLRQCVRP
jgi:hypothetical protein